MSAVSSRAACGRRAPSACCRSGDNVLVVCPRCTGHPLVQRSGPHPRLSCAQCGHIRDAQLPPAVSPKATVLPGRRTLPGCTSTSPSPRRTRTPYSQGALDGTSFGIDVIEYDITGVDADASWVEIELPDDAVQRFEDHDSGALSVREFTAPASSRSAYQKRRISPVEVQRVPGERFSARALSYITGFAGRLSAEGTAQAEHLLEQGEPGEAILALTWGIRRERVKITADELVALRDLGAGLVERRDMPLDLADRVAISNSFPTCVPSRDSQWPRAPSHQPPESPSPGLGWHGLASPVEPSRLGGCDVKIPDSLCRGDAPRAIHRRPTQSRNAPHPLGGGSAEPPLRCCYSHLHGPRPD